LLTGFFPRTSALIASLTSQMLTFMPACTPAVGGQPEGDELAAWHVAAEDHLVIAAGLDVCTPLYRLLSGN
jgi:hypothetical protein